MLNLIQKKHVVCLMMAVLFVSIAATSMANAREVDVTSPPTQVEDDRAADTPNLIMTLDGDVTEPENQGDEPNLYQTQDTPLVDDDNSTVVIAPHDEAGAAEEDNLIATQTSPDLSVLIAGCASLLVAAAAVSVLMLVRRRKAE